MGIGIELAKRLNGEIISADSMQIYKYMNIGTAKPTIEEMQGIPHHLIDFLEIGETFSVVQYKKLAVEFIEDIISRGKTPIIVGGTGLYINSIIDEIKYDENAENTEIRKELEKIASENGNEVLYNELKEVDIESYNRLHLNDTKRIIRALEVYKATGITITEHQKMSKEIEKKYDYRIIGLLMDREKLYNRINLRVDLMMEHGLENEAKSIIERVEGSGRLTSFQAIGYKEFVKYFNGEITLKDAIENIKQESRRYAKRQMTWFKRTNGLKWVDVERNMEEVIKEIIDYYEEEK